MSPKDAAELLRVSRPTVLRMVQAGRLTPIDPINPVLHRQRMRFYRADVERVANEPPPPPKPRKSRKPRLLVDPPGPYTP